MKESITSPAPWVRSESEIPDDDATSGTDQGGSRTGQRGTMEATSPGMDHGSSMDH